MEDNKANENRNNDLISQEEEDDLDNLDDLRGSNLRGPSYHPENDENYINDFPILIDMGFEEKMIKKVYIFLKPRNIEQAIHFMTEDNGIYHHNFYKSTHSNSQKCFICGALERHHIGNSNIHIGIPQDNTTPGRVSSLKRSILSWSSTLGTNKRNEDIPNTELNDKLIESNENIIEQSHSVADLSDFKCLICYSDLTKEEERNYSLSCGHYCCHVCWFEYLKSKITDAKVSKIPCTSYKCTVILTEDFIMKFIKDDTKLSTKYTEFKKKADILDNPNRKFCPHPNCNSFLEKSKAQKEKYVSCENGHNYCYVCLKPWHGKQKCDEELDKDFQLWKKDKVIKRCPKCQFYTEKNEGCNHMTCAECKYQWCWLCEGRYFPRHYEMGRCKGLQFAKRNDAPERKVGDCCGSCCICCCSCFADEDSDEPCLEECLQSDPFYFASECPCLHFFYLFVLLFFGIIPLLTIGAFLGISEDMEFSDVKGFLNVLSICFGIVNAIYFQIIGTGIVLLYTVLTIFYPPANTFYFIRSIMNEEF